MRSARKLRGMSAGPEVMRPNSRRRAARRLRSSIADPQPWGPPVPAYVQTIPLRDGDAGVQDTIERMEALVETHDQGAQNPFIRKAAIAAVRGVAPRDTTSEIARVFRFVKDTIAWRDEKDEILQTPLTTLQQGAGDCDDAATLAGALLSSLGHPVRFETAATNPEAPEEENHVYPQVLDRARGAWIPMDTTVARSYPGWKAENVTRTRTWRPLLQRPHVTLHGLGDDTALAVPADVNPNLAYGLQYAQPVLNALSYRLAPQPSFSFGFNPSYGFGAPGSASTGVPGWAWLVLAGVLGYAALKGR